MTAEPQDAKSALDAVEEDVELGRSEPDELLTRLATILLGLQTDSPHRPRAHRLLGVVDHRMKLAIDALRELREAKTLAEAASPPDYCELAKIGREAAIIYAAHGDDRRAAAELLPALAFASLEGDQPEVAKIVIDLADIEFEAQRFDGAALLLRQLVAQRDNTKLPPHQARRIRINLCQALNRLGAHDEAFRHVAVLRADLPEDEKHFQFSARLEEARALGGLRRFDEAERALLEAEALLPEKDSAIERSEFLQAVTELHEVRGGPPAVKSLEYLIREYAKQQEPVREAVACRALASVRFKLGENGQAREVLARSLRAALQSNLGDIADDIRADIARSAGAGQIEDLADATRLIVGNAARERRFVLVGQLDKGRTGNVYRAIDLADGQFVALKKIDLGEFGDGRYPEITSAIEMAYGPAGEIDNTRFARLLDLRMEPGGALNVVQRFVEGPTLGQIYGSGATPARLLELLAGVAEALVVLHARNVVHRDLMPENVIVTRNAQGGETPMIIDLGIALVASRPDERQLFGTPPYMAPEQVAGGVVDAPADVYALGQMIAEIWGGKLTSHSALGKLWQKDAPDTMPRDIGDLVGDMLEPDPGRRLSDLSSVAQALRAQSQHMVSA